MVKRRERHPNRTPNLGIGKLGGGSTGEPMSHVRVIPNAVERAQEEQSKLESKYYFEMNPYEYGPLDIHPEGPDGRN